MAADSPKSLDVKKITMTIDFEVHDPKSIGFFLSLRAGHIPRLEVIPS